MGDDKAPEPKKRFRYTLKVNGKHLQSDGRKLAISALTAGVLGAVLQTDLVLFRDAFVLVVLGVLIWLLVYVEPTGKQKGE
jgi:hypothetical protein|tara:strand:- start:303 stop:545 length:243 start_codon:yes stop_codon:yes gene_type:complete